MSDASSQQAVPTGFNIRSLLFSLVLNVAIPVLLYTICKDHYHTSDVIALSVAAIFPIVDSVFEVLLHHRLDLIAIISLSGSVSGIVGVLAGGSPELLLIRESLFTGVLGLLCFISFLFPRPLMFYFGRQIMVGNDVARIAVFNEQWKIPRVRFVHRLITLVWGCAFISEFLVRVILVYILPPVLVLVVAPVVTTAIVVVTLLWTFAYVRYVRRQINVGKVVGK